MLNVRGARLLVAALLLAAVSGVAFAALQEEPEEGWPREIPVDAASVLVFQPQPEALDGNMLSGRAAVSVERPDEEPVFGVVWFKARLETDRDERIASVDDLTVTRVGFPAAEEAQRDSLAEILEREIPAWELDIAMDRLLTSLELAETRRKSAEGLNMDPPVILFSLEPAVLVSIDGAPRLQQVEGSDLMRVLNTAFTIIFDRNARTYWLAAGEDEWYSAPEYDGPWTVTEQVPAQVAALAPEPAPEEELPEDELPEGVEAEAEDEGPVSPPTIIVATEPTELIVIDGQPELTPISGTDLMYVSNSESDVLLELESARYFVILSGRWFASESFDGSWVNVPADQLPEGFAEIPFESDMGHLLISVAGTEQAKEAAMENEIPQTAAIKRDATIEVEYDGEPVFEPIEGTDMSYAANTADQVIQVENRYYAVHEGVWYEADSPEGSWTVATEVPDEVYQIPANSPVYNVTYVEVYQSTPEVVYVGYYPGYTHSYVHRTVVVWGTGWHHPGWVGHWFFPRPATWGFHARWNPWWGWSFGFGWSTGPFTFHIGMGSWWRGGWWGPSMWRGYHRGFHRGWHQGYRSGFRAGYRAGSNAARRNNIYNRPRNIDRNVPSDRARGDARGRVAEGRDNNVFADRNGDVFRNNNGNWEQRTRDGWQGNDAVNRDAARERASTMDRSAAGNRTGQINQGDLNRAGQVQRPQQQPSGQRQQTQRASTGQNLQRSQNARSAGAARTSNFN
ncbi:MAG: carbohydrate-binding family V/XII, partial [Gemmatimonadetes bacterium]|nr:carbohydrate-binding family V/XII [Gemmatimonadota bacterium]